MPRARSTREIPRVAPFFVFLTALVLAPVALPLLPGCAREPRTISGPPLSLTPLPRYEDTDAGAPDAAAPAPASSASPVRAAFVELDSRTPRHFAFEKCETIAVVAVSGSAHSLGVDLKPGDVLLVKGGVPFTVHGDGLAVVAHVDPPACEAAMPRTTTKELVKATAPELTWGHGAMHAHLDVGPEVSPNAYIGRLDGTAPVAEHTHPMSWEILCAVQAAGTFTLAGAAKHLGPREIVVVPPGVKHSWSPDVGAKLVGVQFYAPPGPEQRFRTLAAQEAAGAPDGGRPTP